MAHIGIYSLNCPQIDTSDIRQKIEAEISKTTALLKEHEVLTAPVAPDEAIGRVSRMDAINNKSVNEATLRKNKEKLSGLQHALSRLDSPDFAIRAQCKLPIPLGRILIRPKSVHCVNCAH